MERLISMLIIVLVSYIAARFLLKWIFKSSIMFTMAHLMVILIMLVSVDMSLVGQMGQIHAAWAVPLNFGVGVYVFLLIRKKIAIPLQRAIQQVQDLSDGNLKLDIGKTNSKNEIGILNNSLYQLVEKLKSIIGEIQVSADNLTNNSTHLSSISEELSQGAAEQASNLEEVSSTFEEISATIDQNIEKAKETGNISATVREGVTDMVNGLKYAMDTYEKISQHISGVNDISFQINILSLNAAVEAAHAGEYGQGFAVVAAEVRKLADASKDLAANVSKLSEKSQQDTTEATKSMNELMPEIEMSNNHIQDFVSSNIEQGSSVVQVNNSIQQMNNVTQQNASASEEMAANAEEMAAQAESLTDLIKFFKL
ncbi:MAG: methyl-accepting chemotaxis protein [Prolixibacteraceae bacterium]|jgi:methyl-accepting chemotaxis protein|nr:methyl-accepting chemotaxis protein [Prolixibacteraceae bacterium]